MNKRIIYLTIDGGVAIIVPSDEFMASHTIEEVAKKDVPAGRPFKIVNESEIPVNIPIEAWEIDVSELIDGIGGGSNEFPNPSNSFHIPAPVPPNLNINANIVANPPQET